MEKNEGSLEKWLTSDLEKELYKMSLKPLVIEIKTILKD